MNAFCNVLFVLRHGWSPIDATAVESTNRQCAGRYVTIQLSTDFDSMDRVYGIVNHFERKNYPIVKCLPKTILHSLDRS